jgi:hypothetical protein
MYIRFPALDAKNGRYFQIFYPEFAAPSTNKTVTLASFNYKTGSDPKIPVTSCTFSVPSGQEKRITAAIYVAALDKIVLPTITLLDKQRRQYAITTGSWELVAHSSHRFSPPLHGLNSYLEYLGLLSLIWLILDRAPSAEFLLPASCLLRLSALRMQRLVR